MDSAETTRAPTPRSGSHPAAPVRGSWTTNPRAGGPVSDPTVRQVAALAGNPSLCTVQPVDDLLTERLAELAVGFGAHVPTDQNVLVAPELGGERLGRAAAAPPPRAGARDGRGPSTEAVAGP